MTGEYHRKLGGGDHIEKYTLSLNEDGSFFFHSYKNVKRGIPPEVHKYGKGTWRAETKQRFSTHTVLITFFADGNKDFDDKHTLDFNNSKARLIMKSTRDKTDKNVEVKLQFYASDDFLDGEN
ncbi:hypothetical protein [Flagellimonas sp.]|uniref:hypothetical protein n=1 Tax=Flagellimonas sp. TaxID=2058762 RepID=UPI003B58BCF7